MDLDYGVSVLPPPRKKKRKSISAPVTPGVVDGVGSCTTPTVTSIAATAE